MLAIDTDLIVRYLVGDDPRTGCPGTQADLGWMRQGADFADGLHLAKAAGFEAFISFDQDFATAANALGDIKVRAP